MDVQILGRAVQYDPKVAYAGIQSEREVYWLDMETLLASLRQLTCEEQVLGVAGHLLWQCRQGTRDSPHADQIPATYRGPLQNTIAVLEQIVGQG